MVYLSIGVIGFILYYLYDVNSIIWKVQYLHSAFILGTLLQMVATLGLLIQSASYFNFNLLWIITGCYNLAMLIYSLFFALPFEETYIKENNERKVYRKGVYSLCRHPGVLFYMGTYLSIALLYKTFIVSLTVAIWISLNLFYIVVQDYWTFPHTFSDYRSYKLETPFLVPSRKSLRKCIKSQ
ncbi:hypothetical protein [Fusibacter bizertensis]